jgi:hypothetical protein
MVPRTVAESTRERGEKEGRERERERETLLANNIHDGGVEGAARWVLQLASVLP